MGPEPSKPNRRKAGGCPTPSRATAHLGLGKSRADLRHSDPFIDNNADASTPLRGCFEPGHPTVPPVMPDLIRHPPCSFSSAAKTGGSRLKAGMTEAGSSCPFDTAQGRLRAFVPSRETKFALSYSTRFEIADLSFFASEDTLTSKLPVEFTPVPARASRVQAPARALRSKLCQLPSHVPRRRPGSRRDIGATPPVPFRAVGETGGTPLTYVNYRC